MTMVLIIAAVLAFASLAGMIISLLLMQQDAVRDRAIMQGRLSHLVRTIDEIKRNGLPIKDTQL